MFISFGQTSAHFPQDVQQYSPSSNPSRARSAQSRGSIANLEMYRMKYGPANSDVSLTTGQADIHDKHSIQLLIFFVSAYSSGFITAGHS